MITFRSLEEFDKDHGTVKLLDGTLPLPPNRSSAGLTSPDSHRYKSKENTDIVLVPQPTDDPNDPLNWSYTEKVTAMTTVGLLAILSGWVVGGLSSAVPLLMKDFGTSLKETVDAALNWPVLMLGLGVISPTVPPQT
jgi:hypothetical protein